MKKQRIAMVAVSVLLVLTLVFIFGNSLDSRDASSEKSQDVLVWITPLLEPVVGAGQVTEHLVRKLAHFCEFGLLGCELILLALLRGRRGWQPCANCLFAALAAAVTDESLQLLSQRGSQVQDVLLDFSGAVAGIAVILLLDLLLRRQRRAA